MKNKKFKIGDTVIIKPWNTFVNTNTIPADTGLYKYRRQNENFFKVNWPYLIKEEKDGVYKIGDYGSETWWIECELEKVIYYDIQGGLYGTTH